VSANALTASASPSIEQALAHCRAVTRQRARNFYYGLKLSPEPQRSALYVIYAWMRAADDLVDAAHDQLTGTIHQQLEQFRSATSAALRGQTDSFDPLWVALAHVARHFALPPESFNGMLDGQLEDLAHGEHETFDELRNYCYRVASTVGLICIEIWGYEDPRARELAIERGIAFQLTNIIRDYRQDYDAGRIYLPVEDFQRYGIDPQILRAWNKPAACEALMMQQIQRARMYYERSAGLDELISAQCRPTLWAMTAIYRGLLEKMSRNPSRLVMSKRLRLSAMRKGAIAMRARWLVRASRNGSSHGSLVQAPAVMRRTVQ
jgi:phytoene synthase